MGPLWRRWHTPWLRHRIPSVTERPSHEMERDAAARVFLRPVRGPDNIRLDISGQGNRRGIRGRVAALRNDSQRWNWRRHHLPARADWHEMEAQGIYAFCPNGTDSCTDGRSPGSD